MHINVTCTTFSPWTTYIPWTVTGFSCAYQCYLYHLQPMDPVTGFRCAYNVTMLLVPLTVHGPWFLHSTPTQPLDSNWCYIPPVRSLICNIHITDTYHQGTLTIRGHLPSGDTYPTDIYHPGHLPSRTLTIRGHLPNRHLPSQTHTIRGHLPSLTLTIMVPRSFIVFKFIFPL